jgi:hypothetical protein
MDSIREQLIYKDVPVLICFKDLKPIEQYECIRLLLATRTKDVQVCKHGVENNRINSLLLSTKIPITSCST